MKIIDYYVIVSATAIELQRAVNEKIDERGYQPLGGVGYAQETSLYTQAMVKYETKDDVDKKMAADIERMKKDIDEKFLEVAKEECGKENEILRETVISMIERYSKYYHSDGYFIKDGYYEYYSKSHESYPQEILNQILQRRKGIWNAKINPN